jgi:hypothetical protein
MNPSLYQVNTRVWLTQLSRELGRPATLDDVPDREPSAYPPGMKTGPGIVLLRLVGKATMGNE